MFEEHPTFKKPDNENSPIWRYMNLPKFISLLDKKSLFFTRADKFQDPYEGILPKFNELKNNRFDIYQHVISKFKTNQEFEKTIQETIPNSMKYTLNELKKITLINSWYMSNYQSAAMWDLYSHKNSGIAIQSTYKNLKSSFDNNHEDTIWIGKIKYIDYEKEWMDEWNLYEAFAIKRKSFEHEQEIRAVTSLPDRIGPSVYNPQKPKKEPRKIDTSKLTSVGKYVEVDLDILIDRIYLTPFSSPDFHKVILTLLKKYELEKNISISELYKVT